MSVSQFVGGAARTAADAVAVEEPLHLRLAGRSLTVTMRTPGHDEELIAGLLLSEGVIRSPRDLARVQRCPDDAGGNTYDAWLRSDSAPDFSKFSRHVFSSASCGVCGATTIDAVHRNWPAVTAAWRVSPPLISSLPGLLLAQQTVFRETGGLHAAGLFSLDGRLVAVREDIGRHNAVDKILGRALLDSCLPLREHLLMISGRASFEMVQKALAGGIALIAAVSAPSSLAIDLAQRSGQTLIGFVRDERFNVYAHGHRVGPALVKDG
ncbi:MAG: formate dehydrogenase accessory sulfurtransferase FdhD [Planctomycetes bacterium]|nr:formate dehydrogenase accessory sulfurtransferase FdhD [Planctomycetota bacterium]